MRRRTNARASAGQNAGKEVPRSGTAPGLTEGLNRSAGNVRVEVLDGKRFEVPMSGSKRNWKAMSDDELVEYAKAYCKEKGITKARELQSGPNKDSGLNTSITKRKLLDRIFERKDFEEITLDGKTFRIPLDARGYTEWSAMSDDVIVDYAKAYCAEKGITRPVDLEKGPKKNSGLGTQLQKRDLMKQLFERREFEEVVLGERKFRIPLDSKGKAGNRDWSAMGDDEIVEYAKAYCAEKKITRPVDLEKGPDKDNGLYNQLQRKSLMNKVFGRQDFEEVTLDGRTFKIPLDSKQKRNWKAMSDDEIVDYAKAYCKEKGIKKASELQKGPKSNVGLAIQLIRKELTGRVFERKDFEEMALDGRTFRISFNKQGKRNWKAMSDDELVEYAKAYCKEKGITKSSKLTIGPNKNPGLHHQLQNRKLISRVFSEFREAQETATLTELADALETFGGVNEKN